MVNLDHNYALESRSSAFVDFVQADKSYLDDGVNIEGKHKVRCLDKDCDSLFYTYKQMIFYHYTIYHNANVNVEQLSFSCRNAFGKSDNKNGRPISQKLSDAETAYLSQ